MTPTAIASASAIRRRNGRSTSRGQIVVIFAGAMLLFAMLSAAVIDLSWYWTNNLRMQRAADAAALAGAVWLPGDVTRAISTARAEAVKNGYTNGTAGFTVTPTQDPVNPRRLRVTIAGPIGTYFARIVGLNAFNARRDSRAEFVLPVPMGSPENYYGVFGTIRDATYTQPQTVINTDDTGWREATSQPTGTAPNQSTWTNPQRADDSDNNSFAVSTTANGSLQYWSSFGLNFNAGLTAFNGIELRLRALLTGTGNTTTDCRVDAALSWNNGTTWTAVKSQRLTTNENEYILGSDSDLWGRGWTVTELQNLRVRLASNKVTCSGNRTVSVDTLEVQVTYRYGSTTDVTTNLGDVDMRGPGSGCLNGAVGCYNPDGAALNDRGFWATMNSQGASNVNGDAHQPQWDTAGSTSAPNCPAGASRSCYDPNQYYNYGVEMPPGSSNGYVYVFDPGFCATQLESGTADRWFTNTRNTVSSWYEILEDTNLTPYNYSDDTVRASSGTRFMNLRATDSTMGGPSFTGGTECRQQRTAYGDGRDYHNSWYLLNPGAPLSGGAAGRTYRLHTTGTDPRAGGNPGSQSGTDAEQSFSLYVSSTNIGGQGPRIYGLGAMQAFTPLSTSAGFPGQSEFYLAQIEAIHAGKSIQIELWDPGDTAPLTANVQILMPTGGGWTPVNFSYAAKVGTTNGNANSACNTNANANTNNVVTSTGASLGVFNGCWLTITAKIPATYTAPDPGGVGPGWWKIKYNMTGSGTSSDVTTWKVSLIGNPVHLVLP